MLKVYRLLVWLTGTEFQVLLKSRSLLDDWLYDSVMLQLLGTAGTVGKQVDHTAVFMGNACL